MSNQTLDPKAWLDAVDVQWNAHNLEGALSFFARDGVLKFVPPLPGQPPAAVGHDQIRAAIRQVLPGFHVQSLDHRLRDGQTVTWHAIASNDGFRALGLDQVEALGEAVLDAAQIQAMTITFTPETVARLQAALAGATA